MYENVEDMPGYREDFAAAFERQQSTRDLSVLTFQHTLCGESVRLPNLADITALQIDGNAFVTGQKAGPVDAALVVWLLSDQWEPEQGSWYNRRRVMRKRLRMAKRIGKLDGKRLSIIHVEDFLERCFLDAPDGVPGQKPEIPRASYAASFCHLLMSHYKCAEEWVMSLPIPRLMQYYHLIMRDHDPKYRNSQPTDEVRRKYAKRLKELKLAAEKAKGESGQ